MQAKQIEKEFMFQQILSVRTDAKVNALASSEQHKTEELPTNGINLNFNLLAVKAESYSKSFVLHGLVVFHYFACTLWLNGEQQHYISFHFIYLFK